MLLWLWITRIIILYGLIWPKTLPKVPGSDKFPTPGAFYIYNFKNIHSFLK